MEETLHLKLQLPVPVYRRQHRQSDTAQENEGTSYSLNFRQGEGSRNISLGRLRLGTEYRERNSMAV